MGINKPLKAAFGFDFLIGKSVGGNTACGIGNINGANLVAVNIVCLNKPDIFYFAPPCLRSLPYYGGSNESFIKNRCQIANKID